MTEPGEPPQVIRDGTVTPVPRPPEREYATPEQLQREICKAFGVKPWLIGLAPVPWWVPYWVKIRFPFDLVMARKRGLRRVNGKWVERD